MIINKIHSENILGISGLYTSDEVNKAWVKATRKANRERRSERNKNITLARDYLIKNCLENNNVPKSKIPDILKGWYRVDLKYYCRSVIGETFTVTMFINHEKKLMIRLCERLNGEKLSDLATSIPILDSSPDDLPINTSEVEFLPENKHLKEYRVLFADDEMAGKLAILLEDDYTPGDLFKCPICKNPTTFCDLGGCSAVTCNDSNLPEAVCGKCGETYPTDSLIKLGNKAFGTESMLAEGKKKIGTKNLIE